MVMFYSYLQLPEGHWSSYIIYLMCHPTHSFPTVAGFRNHPQYLGNLRQFSGGNRSHLGAKPGAHEILIERLASGDLTVCCGKWPIETADL